MNAEQWSDRLLPVMLQYVQTQVVQVYNSACTVDSSDTSLKKDARTNKYCRWYELNANWDINIF